jgi:hypothetical protein
VSTRSYASQRDGFRSLLADRGVGPHRAWEPVAAYLRAEQALGRVAADADTEQRP